MKRYYIDVVYKSGSFNRLWLSEGTWTVWGARCASHNNNPFAKGKVLFGFSESNGVICLRTKELATVVFESLAESQPQLDIRVRQANPLNDEKIYDNPLN